MKSVFLVVLLLAMSFSAQAKTYVCDTKRIYDLKDGALVPAKQEPMLRSTWPTIVFNDDTGIFKYGREGDWTEEEMIVRSKGSTQLSASGHYMHNGTILRSLIIHSWASPVSFVWTTAASADVFTGTCQIDGN